MRSPRPITQSRIAQKAGVSQAAVSAVLSGSGVVNVGEETRSRILSIAQQLGYVARKSGAVNGNGGSRSQSVLIVESEPPERPTNESWMDEAYQTLIGKILAATGRHLRQHGVGLSVFHLNDPTKLIQWLADSDINGVIWHATELESSLLHWVASRFPLVLLNKSWEADVPCDIVSIDHEKNITIAADYLWTRGHRKICTFGHNPENSFYRRRVAAYQRFVADRGLRDYSEFQGLSDDMDVPALNKVHSILNLWQQMGDSAPTAIITSDVFALPLLIEAKNRHIKIPGELSVIGIDNTGPCSLVEPQLTSMEQPFEEMCRSAVEMLLRRREDPSSPSYSVQIAPRLIARKSISEVKPRSLEKAR